MGRQSLLLAILLAACAPGSIDNQPPTGKADSGPKFNTVFFFQYRIVS